MRKEQNGIGSDNLIAPNVTKNYTELLQNKWKLVVDNWKRNIKKNGNQFMNIVKIITKT